MSQLIPRGERERFGIFAKRGQDADGDGYTNIEEFLNQTDPQVSDRRPPGFDFEAMQKAIEKDIKLGKLKYGGSTISQQLAKTSFTGGERTMTRKAQEALITIWLEAWLSKEEILKLYLDRSYLGGGNYGLVQTRDGLIHRVLPGNHLGQNDGRVTAVSDSRITLVEIIPDGLGGYLERPAALALAD